MTEATPHLHQEQHKRFDSTAFPFSRLQGLAQQAEREHNYRGKQQIKRERLQILQGLPDLTDETAQDVMRGFNDRIGNALDGLELTLLQAHREKLLFIDEAGKLNELKVTEENAREKLNEIKRLDEHRRDNSYTLRQEILHRSNGRIMTWEAYTYADSDTLDIHSDDFWDYLKDPESWLPTRRKTHRHLIEEENRHAYNLSDRFEAVTETPTIYCLRGNTAAGKTTALKKYDRLRPALNPEDGEPEGVINPDDYKVLLRKKELRDGKHMISHQQTHHESSSLASMIEEGLLREDFSVVIDRRLVTHKNVEDYIMAAQNHGKKLEIIDIDVPLELSLISVLAREPDGNDPRVPFEEIAKGFVGIRSNREAIIKEAERREQAEQEPPISYYMLSARDENDVVPVAEVLDGDLAIEKETLYLIAINGKGSNFEVENVKDKIIDDDYITSILPHFHTANYREKVRRALNAHKGKSFQQALDDHAR